MNTLKELLKPHIADIKASENQMVALIFKIYQIGMEMLENIIQEMPN